MKVLIYFKVNQRKDVFEAMRLRKNIKGALELVNVIHTPSVVDSYDIVHFLTLNDEIKINDALSLREHPVCISALMCESDSSARFLETSKRTNEVFLSSRALRVLNKVDLVFAPNQSSKDFLIDSGVQTRIDVVGPGVNISRFEIKDELEKDVFYRYFQVQKKEKIVLSIGDYDDERQLTNVTEAARSCPQAKFFFIGQSKSYFRLKRTIRKLLRHKPDNLTFKPIVQDDIFVSALINADVLFIGNPNSCDPIITLEAMAAKTQIVAVGPLKFTNNLIDKQNCYVGSNSKEAGEIIYKYISGELPPLTKVAFQFAQANSLAKVGEQLVKSYQKAIKLKVQ